MGMTSHIVYQAWDAERPATLSPLVIGGIIRGRIGFDGLLISDDIVMDALSGPADQRAIGALAAGCDLVLHGSGDLHEAERLLPALPEITAFASERLARAAPQSPAEPLPLDELIDKRDALLKLSA
jgi:beta-N-acetylhexosaminidase